MTQILFITSLHPLHRPFILFIKNKNHVLKISLFPASQSFNTIYPSINTNYDAGYVSFETDHKKNRISGETSTYIVQQGSDDVIGNLQVMLQVTHVLCYRLQQCISLLRCEALSN